MLFTSDSDLREEQRATARVAKGLTLSPAELRREAMEADREMREHRRWREFGWLLFVAPALVGLFVALAQWVVLRLMMPTP